VKRVPRIAAVGLTSWDVLLACDDFPPVGGYTVVNGIASLPGGTTSNTALALAKLGAKVTFTGMVGDDEQGRDLRSALEAAGVDVSGIATRVGEPTDLCYLVVSSRPADRTIFWKKGAKIVKGDQLQIPEIFGHDVVLLDVDDPPLIRFLTDLPAHTLPATRLLGTLGYAEEFNEPDRLDVLLRFDTLVGNVREFQAVTGTTSLDDAIAAIRSGMVGANLRAAAISRGVHGGTIVTKSARFDLPAFNVDVVDPTGAGDAFTAGIAWGMAKRLEWDATLMLANALGALATRRLGAQSSLPDWSEVTELTGLPAETWLA
jgi:ribokinase